MARLNVGASSRSVAKDLVHHDGNLIFLHLSPKCRTPSCYACLAGSAHTTATTSCTSLRAQMHEAALTSAGWRIPPSRLQGRHKLPKTQRRPYEFWKRRWLRMQHVRTGEEQHRRQNPMAQPHGSKHTNLRSQYYTSPPLSLTRSLRHSSRVSGQT